VFPLLTSPVALGPMALRNRMALLPHGLFYADRNRLVATERHVEYYSARARGGVGLVCLESSVVSRDGMMVAPLMLATEPAAGDGYRRIAEAVHAEGAKVCGQLTHYGNQGSSVSNRAPLLGPSRLPDIALREAARPVDGEVMARLCVDFAAGAACLAEAGMDGVELKVGHDGILRQFLSPLTNDREDEYGGSIANRMRFVLEVTEAVRAAIGSGVALGIRLGLDEHLPGGYGVEDAIEFTRAFEGSGLVDYISSDAGVFASVDRVVPPMGLTAGSEEETIRRTAQATGLPVIAFGGIRTPEHGERILAEGSVAVIGMARAMLADPEFANKAIAGTPERIRPCTACNQQCVGNSQIIVPVTCTVNPFVGYGERPPRDRPGIRARRVVIAGGGVAGQEAARVAAEAGHSVTLLEAADRLGGQLALAATAPGRAGWRPYLDWLAAELERLKVDTRLGLAATVADVSAMRPDLVVIACGSTTEPALKGGLDVDTFLTGGISGRRVALVDRGAAGMPLWSAALVACERGAAEVTVVTPLPLVGGELDGTTFLTVYAELRRREVRMLTDHVVTDRLPGGELELMQVYSGAISQLECDVVVTSSPRRPAGGELAAGLAAVTTVTVGDAVAPRQAYDAIREGQSILAGGSDPYLVMNPASTNSGTPVMNFDASEARKSIA
jgi:2,4-dienoyl-CoA reductase-like NADH-dependent reductase (Old Yellow Enzyme family)